MTPAIKTYRKRPVEVQALLLTDANIQQVVSWIVDNDGASAGMRVHDTGPLEMRGITIGTLEGDMRAQIGDYVVKGVAGEFYPCRCDIFHKTHDLVISSADLESAGIARE